MTRALLTLRVPWCAWQTESFTQGHLIPICQVGSCGAEGGGRDLPGVCPPLQLAQDAHLERLTTQVSEGTSLFSLPKFMAAFPWDLAPDTDACVREGNSCPRLRIFLQPSGNPYQGAASLRMLHVITASRSGSG